MCTQNRIITRKNVIFFILGEVKILLLVVARNAQAKKQLFWTFGHLIQ